MLHDIISVIVTDNQSSDLPIYLFLVTFYTGSESLLPVNMLFE
jgi:hypothetical protein